MPDVTLDFLAEQQRRILDELQAARAERAAMRDDIRADLAELRERGQRLATALDATRKGLEAKLELTRVELLDAIHVETRSEAIGTRTRVEQELDAIRGQLDALARRLEALESAG